VLRFSRDSPISVGFFVSVVSAGFLGISGSLSIFEVKKR
jgi:hypothetical protein